MGASWSDSSDASWMHNLNTASVAADGQLLLFGPYGQMLRVQLVKVCWCAGSVECVL